MTSPTADIRTRVQVLNILGASLLSQQDTNNAEAAADRAIAEAAGLSPPIPKGSGPVCCGIGCCIYARANEQGHEEIDRLLEEMQRYRVRAARKIWRAPGASAPRLPSRRAIRQRR